VTNRATRPKAIRRMMIRTACTPGKRRGAAGASIAAAADGFSMTVDLPADNRERMPQGPP